MMEVVVNTGAVRRAKLQSDRQSSLPTNQYPAFYRPDAFPVAKPPDKQMILLCISSNKNILKHASLFRYLCTLHII